MPNNLINNPARRAIKNNEVDDVKKLIFSGVVYIDDPIDPNAKHTLLHDSVIMNRVDLFDFLLE